MAEANAIYLSSFFSEGDILIEQTVPSFYNMIHALTQPPARRQSRAHH